MTDSLPPFSGASYELPSCSLACLTAAGAEHLSRQLAVMEPWRSLGYRAAGLLQYLLRPDPALFRLVISIDPTATGLVCIRYPWLRGPYVELLAVLTKQQRRGLGREVISWIQVQCPRTAPNIWALTSSFNTGARSFYRSLGFSEIASLPNLTDSTSDEILLRKRLA